MQTDVDILVIGGGAVGLCCAHYLSRAGRGVTLLEKGDIGSGASLGNAGLVIPNQCIPLAAPGVISKGLKWMADPESPFYIRPRLDLDLFRWLWKFAGHCTDGHVRRAIPVLREIQRVSLALFHELGTTENIDAGLRQNGVLEAYLDSRELENARHTAGLLRRFGLANSILDRDDIRRLLPGLATRFVGAVFYPGDAHLIPERFVRGMARRVEDGGAVIRRATEVIGLHRFGRRIEVVHTTRGDFRAREIVLAGGSWSPQIVADLDLRLFVQPAKGYSISFRKPAGFPDIPLILTEAKVAVTPMDDTLRLAGTLELSGRNLSVNRRRVGAILKSLPAYLPDLDVGNLDLVEIWRGLRPCTPDGLPSIGRSRTVENLIVATGHGMKGISMAPVTGKLVAQIVEGVPTEIDLGPLAPERFARPMRKGMK